MRFTSDELHDIASSEFLDKRFRDRMLSETQIHEYRHHGHSIRLVGQRAPDDLMNRLFTIADWMCQMTGLSGSRDKLHMTCWLYSDRKQLPRSGLPLMPVHLNSGMTVFPSRHIYIWRREEVEKVLIHEMIHALRLDKHWWDKDWPGGYKMAESWTEAMAVFYYQVFLRYCGVHAKLDDTIQRDEIRHNRETCWQLLRHFGYQSMKEMRTDPGQDRWVEETNGWAYYIGRQMIMCSPYFWRTIAKKGMCQWTPTMIQRCLREIDWTEVDRRPGKQRRTKWISATSRAI